MQYIWFIMRKCFKWS